MRYYVRATGNNRWVGGTYRWLKIRDITERGAVKVRIRGHELYTYPGKEPVYNLEFAMGVWPNVFPCKWADVKKGWKK